MIVGRKVQSLALDTRKLGFHDSTDRALVSQGKPRLLLVGLDSLVWMLGIAYLLEFQPILSNIITLLVMLLGLVGVTQALLARRRIQCACSGIVFNL